MRGLLLWNRVRHERLVKDLDAAAEDAQQELDKKEELIISWLKTRGEHDACTALTTRGKRGLFAKDDVKAGDCVLRVSCATILTTNRLPLEFQKLLTESVSERAQLALLLLFEKRAGKASSWSPYISCLPKWGSIHSTAFWRKDELSFIKESSLSHETMHRRETIRDEFAELQQIFQKYQHAFGGLVSYASFKHAYVTVCSRAWQIVGLKKLAMIPFADFLNHDCDSKAVLSYNSETGHAELFADTNYTAGEQLVVNYGPLSNACLALDFGFTLAYNPWDKVELWMGISGRDPLRKKKLQYLHSSGMLTLINPDDSDSGGMSFTLREVRSVTGEGNEFPQTLFTMARVICATSAEELCSCTMTQKEALKEIRALTYIMDRVESVLQRHVKAVLDLQAKLTDAKSTTSLCLEMAEAVLGGELRVLRSATAWLKHRCDDSSTIY